MKSCIKNLLTPLPYNLLISRAAHAVRVRFAPSPTGHLHLGGLRTALYNYLYAFKHGGKFILRIEDTDQTRLVPGATKSIVEDLQWAGIQIDEGPSFGGSFGPYIQSERRHIYDEAVARLLRRGLAYRCYCTEKRLDLLRREALKRRQVPKYDNKCRYLSSVEHIQRHRQKNPFCIRFRLDDYNEPVEDIVKGNTFVNSSMNEGDPVIIKSDGLPTYHFANVIDDHDMRITHVFRGIEWQTSTPKHLLLYKAFGWTPPKYGHLPLLINADGTKLSKRQGDISIRQYRDIGVFPLALLNYVMVAGGGFQNKISPRLTIENIDSLANRFNIENLNTHPGRLNPHLLNEFNKLELKRRLRNEEETNELVRKVKFIVSKKFPDSNFNLEDANIKNILRWSVDRLSYLDDIISEQFEFLWTEKNTVHTTELTEKQITDLVQKLEGIQFSKENIIPILTSYAERAQIKFSVLMKNLRTALSGSEQGPAVAEIMEVFGKEESLRRIRAYLISTTGEKEQMCK